MSQSLAKAVVNINLNAVATVVKKPAEKLREALQVVGLRVQPWYRQFAEPWDRPLHLTAVDKHGVQFSGEVPASISKFQANRTDRTWQAFFEVQVKSADGSSTMSLQECLNLGCTTSEAVKNAVSKLASAGKKRVLEVGEQVEHLQRKKSRTAREEQRLADLLKDQQALGQRVLDLGDVGVAVGEEESDSQVS